MNLKRSKQLVKFMYKAQQKSGVRCPVFFWGGAGVGKTQAVKQAAEELSLELFNNENAIKYINLRLAVKPDAGDIVGLPHKVETFPCAECIEDSGGADGLRYSQGELFVHLQEKHEGGSLDDALKHATNGLKHLIEVRTEFTAPRDIPLKGPAILFLDEVNRANRAVLDAAFTLLEDGRAGVHQLPKDILIICAGNPPTDDYQVQDIDQERAFMERCVHIVVSPSQEEWIEHAFETKHNDQVVQAVVSSPEFLGNNNIDPDFLSTLRPGPRNMSKISHLMNMGLTEEFGKDDAFIEVLGGIIGAKHAQVFRAKVMDTEQPVPPNEIINKFESVKDRIKRYGDGEKSRYDLLHHTNHGMLHLLKNSEVELGKPQYKNIGKYILALPKDLAFSLLKLFTKESSTSREYRHIMKVVDVEPSILKMLSELNEELRG